MLSEDELRDALLLVFANKQVGLVLLLYQCLRLCDTCRLLSDLLWVEWSTVIIIAFRQSAQLVKCRAGGNNLYDATGHREAKVAGVCTAPAGSFDTRLPCLARTPIAPITISLPTTQRSRSPR